VENKKNNKIVIVLLIVIIIILLGLCVLFATGTISFKSNDVQNIEEKYETTYYQWYPDEDDSLGGTHSMEVLELNVDGTAKLYGGKRNSSGWSYEGTYIENDSKIVFSGKATLGFEDLLGTDEYVKTFKKQGKNLYDERNFEYSRVSSEELKR